MLEYDLPVWATTVLEHRTTSCIKYGVYSHTGAILTDPKVVIDGQGSEYTAELPISEWKIVDHTYKRGVDFRIIYIQLSN